jgi:hypothetical protein
MIKRPIDIQRDSAGKFSIESQDDGTPITDMFQLNDALLLMTQKAAYEVRTGDQIDPKRENPNIPHNVQRRILGFGTDSELVGRTLLTAKSLIRKEFLPATVDVKQVMTLTFEVLKDLIAMHTISTEYESAEKKEIEVAHNRAPKQGSLAIPSITDVDTLCKTFAQKADHVEQATWDILRVFYPEIQAKCNFEIFCDFVKNKFGADDPFTKFLVDALPFIMMVRNTRDCLDHRNAKGVVVTNFSLLANGTILRPTIEINFRGTRQPSVFVARFLSEVVENMVIVFENLIGHLCSKNIKFPEGLPLHIGIIPETRRVNKYVQYSIGMTMNDQFFPIG